MGLGKALKKAVKQTVGGVKAFADDPTSKKGLESLAGATFAAPTGGASLALITDAGRRAENQAQEEERKLQAQADLVAKNTREYGYGNLAQLAEATQKKQEDLASRETKKARGISSLVGGGTTLG